jgi:hypothetical protein
VFNVIPQDATEAEAVSIFLEAWRRGKETVGGSYDDAGIGELTDKTARLYNIPEHAQQEFKRFYQEHYPDVKVVFAESSGVTYSDPIPPAPKGYDMNVTTIIQPFEIE